MEVIQSLPGVMLGKLAAHPTMTWTIIVVGLSCVCLWYAMLAAVRRPMELAKDHWSRQPQRVRPKFSKRTHPLEFNWVYESCKPTSEDGPLTGTFVGRQTWRPDPSSPPSATGFVAADNMGNPSDLLFRKQMLGDHSTSTGRPHRGSSSRQSRSSAGPVGIAVAARGGNSGLPATGAPARGDRDNTDANTALRDAVNFYSELQSDDGHWAADYGGPLFLLPLLVFTSYITGFDLGDARRSAMLTFIRNHQQEDGGWGLHTESPSTMFGSVLNYVSMRILGLPSSAPEAVRGRGWIRSHGGAVSIPSWGKFWLAVMNLFSYDGLNPLPAELWLLPNWFPFHPGRLWCHCRMVYLPMSYLYSLRATGELTPLIAEIRQEIFITPYDTINWNKARNDVCDQDLYSPHTWLCDRLFDFLRLYERCPSRYLRRKGLQFCLEYMNAEDMQTNYVDIGPVNKSANMLAIWFANGGRGAGNESEAFRRHAARVEDYLWVAEDGMKMSGYNGSQLWDTAFATQALLDAGMKDFANDTIARSHQYIKDTQIKEDVPQRERFYRHISKGGWPFSTADHGWPISDCTSEGLKVALSVRKLGALPEDALIKPDRLEDAVNVLLSFQNSDGGWATYEQNRGWSWFEWFNPSEVFGDIMIDYSYVECTSASVTALCAFHEQFPNHRSREVRKAITNGAQFLRNAQRPDGSWYGCWAVCFTYAAWFGVEGLRAAGEPLSSPRFAASSKFLLSKQQEDGGWGESYLSCVTKEYQASESTVVNTSWALLALMHADCKDTDAVQDGIRFLISRQLTSGDWPQERVAGIFNRTCGIYYTAYRNVFPIWALGVYNTHYAPAHQLE